MTTVYLTLGSNVGDSRQHIAGAIDELGKLLGNLREAPIYTSRAVGYTDQPDFLNTAVAGSTDLPPLELLAAVKAIEQRLGRVERFRWGPREIDIDIIFYGDTVLESPELTVPHPNFRDRDFVLLPLIELNPDLTDPVSHQSVKEIYQQLPADHRSISTKP